MDLNHMYLHVCCPFYWPPCLSFCAFYYHQLLEFKSVFHLFLYSFTNSSMLLPVRLNVTVFSLTIDRLGDQKDSVREAAKVLLRKLMTDVSTPQVINIVY